ncbi:MAG: helix-hairpin-helix domain-containing protein [Halobellus sp.]
MTGDRESEGDGESAGDGLDPDAVVTPRGDGSAADSGATGEAELGVPLPWTTASDDDADPDSEGDEEDDTESETDAEAEADGSAEARPIPEEFEDLHFVGPKTAPVLEDSGIAIADVCEKRVSYRDLTEAGVNPGVAAKIRREHSLSWSLDGGGTDLDRRSSQIRGLDDDERAWIAESSGWSDREDAAEADGSGDAADGEAAWRARTGGDPSDPEDALPPEESDTGSGGPPATDGEAAWRAESGVGLDGGSGSDADADAESAWRRQSAPTPLTAVAEFDEKVATTLRKAGIGSVRRLATADPESVADALDLDVDRVRAWRDRAIEHENSA